jgi:hypothetical protein
MTQLVQTQYRELLCSKFIEWLLGGPDEWLAEWQKIMVDSSKWYPAIHDTWASDFNLIWAEVLEAKRLCDRLVEASTAQEKAQLNTFETARQLHQAWKEMAIRWNMKTQGQAQEEDED